MDTLKVCISRIISSLTKSLESSLHKCTYTTTKYSLLSEEVCLCLCSECCLKNSGSCSTDSKTISKCSVKSFSCVILLYSYQTRCSFSSLILASYCMSWCLRCDHCNINILRWYDCSEMDVESVSEHKHVTLFKVWLDVFFVKFSLFLIVDQNHDDVSLLCSFSCCIYFESLLFCFLPRTASLVQTDDNITS